MWYSSRTLNILSAYEVEGVTSFQGVVLLIHKIFEDISKHHFRRGVPLYTEVSLFGGGG